MSLNSASATFGMEIAGLATVMEEADHETLSLERSVKQDLEALRQKNLQFRFEAVENVMAPLIHQVNILQLLQTILGSMIAA